jgi:iron complex outermembrane receptor protein/outer membrane receptor for ferrienterochelin and colicins
MEKMLKKVLLTVTFMIAARLTFAQYEIRIAVKEGKTLQPLEGATISTSSSHTLSNKNGVAELTGITSPQLHITISFTGFVSVDTIINSADSAEHVILMLRESITLHDVVIVATTRSNDRIENSATKVEVLSQGDMNEESTLKPGNIASILGDISGVQIQQSSATSGNTNVRMQGLEGRYTQILLDGMPLYGGYSGGFGVLSIAPLDLKQIELIKGSSSTLYGGGAIAGLVNLVSKKPKDEPELTLLLNRTTLSETNANIYAARRFAKAGFTFFGGQTTQHEKDVNSDGFSDVPRMHSTIIHPTLFFFPTQHSSISIGWAGSFDSRIGGDMIAIDGNKSSAHPYFENNNLKRNTATLIAETRSNESLTWVLKSSVSFFNRNEESNTYVFKGQQQSYYGELSLVKSARKHLIVAGINVTGERFRPSASTPAPVGSFNNNLVGVFVQDSYKITASTKLETGLRADHHHTYGDFLLPRLALFQKLSEKWGARLNIGMGYSVPNPLNPQVKDFTIYQIEPLADNVGAEKSYGGNFDVNFKQSICEEGSFFVNQSFFVTHISDPITGVADQPGNLFFVNMHKPVVTKGSDTYIQLAIPHWEIYVGYKYTQALWKYLSDNQFIPYTPRHRAAATLVYEVEDNWRTGIEASYNGYQYRDEGGTTPAYWFMAAMAEKKFGDHFSVALNCENLFDERQSRYESLYTGDFASPQFRTLWAPIDGRVFNLSVKYSMLK